MAVRNDLESPRSKAVWDMGPIPRRVVGPGRSIPWVAVEHEHVDVRAGHGTRRGTEIGGRVVSDDRGDGWERRDHGDDQEVVPIVVNSRLTVGP